MALKSNRVGVRTDQVDVYGRVTSKSFLQSILDHLPRWTSLKVWKNGTEQLLPVNTDEPVTSPIVADIQYPTDSSATEQMFTYRKSPTEADGEAYIQSIKGNTIVWNQIVNDVQAKSEVYGITRTKVTDGNKIGLQYTGTAESTQNFTAIFSLPFVIGHKYLCTLGASLPTGTRISLSSTDRVSSVIVTISTTVTFGLLITSGTTVDITTYPQAFDLTAMFGAGKEPTTVEQFTALFPLPYYQYDAGSLLSFNGTGIKTIGFNQWDEELELGTIAWNTGANTESTTIVRSKNYTSVFGNKEYYLNIPSVSVDVHFYDVNKTHIGPLFVNLTQTKIITTPSDCAYIRFMLSADYGTEYKDDICINISNSLKNGTYESYTTSTTTIPTDTYFPTGMKSAGTVYDEFTSSRAYTRIGEVDLGTLTWQMSGSGDTVFFYADTTSLGVASTITVSGKQNYICDKYEIVNVSSTGTDTGIGFASATQLRVRDTTYTSASDFTTAMDGVMLQFELKEEIIEPTLEFDEE